MNPSAELEAFYDKVTEGCLAAAPCQDPVALATKLMSLPGFPMHYPVHHYLVPAVLLTVCRNRQGQDPQVLRRDLAEALVRSRNVPGGFCGNYGACGAAIGVGIFWSIITDSSPLSEATWGYANRATGSALLKLAEYGGPRCCKRCTWLALQDALAQISTVLGLDLTAEQPRCSFHDRNEQCLKARCPFYPVEEA